MAIFFPSCSLRNSLFSLSNTTGLPPHGRKAVSLKFAAVVLAPLASLAKNVEGAQDISTTKLATPSFLLYEATVRKAHECCIVGICQENLLTHTTPCSQGVSSVSSG